MSSFLQRFDALPLQVLGFVDLGVAIFDHSLPYREVLLVIGLAVYFAGDALFFFQQKAKGCL